MRLLTHPSLLSGERLFNARFGRAVQAAKYSKRGSRESEAGMLAVGALHKQIMPFVLRRTKQQVLHDLPPKIITDIVCDLTPFQVRRQVPILLAQGGLVVRW